MADKLHVNIKREGLAALASAVLADPLSGGRMWSPIATVYAEMIRDNESSNFRKHNKAEFIF
jgi:hypothetical protein